ncbi:Lipase, class 3 [Kalmanozyma brasiliensis GHG001]|uniref:Lipase, class 3 n=1 Tax=Kalmanozyma brasiliensis (strain GHG001) TaxID=1365824 RepID=UPI001CEA80DD|nr:Lipase, class 3 [Kalmanozyma brasiliensis GHG001]EST04742.2 Lipase, class 3 [Kalmanozyma brasiliensis GHG001]
MSSTAQSEVLKSSEPRSIPPSAASSRPQLLDLDLDELSPLPPAHGLSNSRTASLERIPSLKLNGTPRVVKAHPVAASPAFSAAPSSFRLEGSPPSSPQATQSPELLTHDSVSDQRSLDKQQPTLHLDTSLDHNQNAPQSDPPSVPAPAPSARYVTVSAILSRSNIYYAPETSEHWDLLRSPTGLPADADLSHNTTAWPSTSSEPFSSMRRRRSQRKRPSNGSAIEALGALLLRKDSSGRVASLSFAKDDDFKKGKGRSTDPLKHSIQAWTSSLSSLSKNGLRLQLPNAKQTQKPPSHNKGATIAERRAQMWHQILTRQGAVVEDGRDGFSKVRSRRGGLSFEVGNRSRKQMPSTLLQLDGYKPHGKRKDHDGEEQASKDLRLDHIGDDDSGPLATTSADFDRPPGTIMLKAGRRPRLTQLSKSEFGIGSAYHDQMLPEAPPSPVAMPGAWQGGSSWRSKPGDGFEEGALLLPPPLLDDNGSDASSFEGLLGVRRMREREKARKHAEKMAARNRPAHKVGPLTALTNFVKAAHAAETSAKRARGDGRFGQAPAFFRSFTEPQRPSRARSDSSVNLSGIDDPKLPTAAPIGISSGKQPGTPTMNGASMAPPVLPSSLAAAAVTPSANDAEARKSPAVTSVSPFMSPATRRAALSRRESRNNSIDTAGRQLNTVFEFEPLDPSKIPDDELASPDLPPISSPLLQPSSRSSSKTSAFRDFPTAPRLLPVQLSVPPSPFTPLAIDHRELRSSIGSGHADYLSARNLHAAPRTPQLVATMLSLPPSPWTPYQDSAAMHAAPMVHLHLNTSSSSLRLPPGTPRLVPTHIEILPSPYPTSASSRRGSLTNDSPQGLRATSLTRSPLTGAVTDFTSFAALRESQAANVGSKPATETLQSAVKHDEGEIDSPSEEAQSRGALRHTPSSMLVATQSTQDAGIGVRSASSTDPRTHSPGDDGASHGEQERSSGSRSRRPSASHIHVDPSGRQRSFVLWFLIGDLGLRSTGSSSDDKRPEADHGGVIALLVHAFAFFTFVTAHLVDLGYSIYERVSLVLWFLRWMVYNLAGRTVLAQCAIEAYSFIQAEWATVALEDHEEKGSKKKPDQQGDRKPRGLTRFQVLRGILELYCLHSVTRDRYVAEGAGLTRLDGWRRPSNKDDKGKAPKGRGSDRLDIGAQRAASRAAFDEERLSWSQQQGRDVGRDHEDLDPSTATILGNGNGLPHHAQTGDETDAKSNGYGPDAIEAVGGGDNDNEEEVEEEEDSSDDEMIVTNRGDDILEFAKTPRLDATRPGQASSGYFGRAYDFMTSPQVGASKPELVSRDLRPFKETNRDLVRTIKWCGRLAISAYGLHVHIVDLPPTFTPSGDRFSRQTFAYLSRLNADDVLHADIQTLDADADYSPTFYIVRDYVRKVVCVAVRGTQSFSDIIVDLELQTEEIELPQVQPTPGEEFRCHAGIWRAAKALVSPQSKLFATLRQALAENEGFGVMFCGHSLGGAIASAAVLLLAEYFIPDGGEPDAGTWVTNMSSGLPARRPIRAVSFASPVTMTADLAARAALGSVPLVTTVVLGSDVIPRVGHGQVRELRRVLGALSRVRRRHAMASSDGQDDARVHILRSYWDWRSISMAEDVDEVMLHRKERIEEQLWSLRREVESDLYAAIKARLDAGTSAGARIPPSPWVGPQQRDQAPLHALSARRQELDTATLRSEAAQGGPLIPPGRCIWINDKQVYHVESPLAFFSLPELRSDMFAAHFPAAYEEAILELKV